MRDLAPWDVTCVRRHSWTVALGFFFDACIVENLMWSWMCPPCFFGLGCGVGQGTDSSTLVTAPNSILCLECQATTSTTTVDSRQR